MSVESDSFGFVMSNNEMLRWGVQAPLGTVALTQDIVTETLVRLAADATANDATGGARYRSILDRADPVEEDSREPIADSELEAAFLEFRKAIGRVAVVETWTDERVAAVGPRLIP